MDTASSDAAERRLDYVPLDDIAGTDGNPKEHDLPAVIRSIASLGYTAPVMLDERTGRLILGNGRLAALRVIRAYVNGDDIEERYEPLFGEKPVKKGLSGADGAARPPGGIRIDGDGRWLVPVVRGWASADDDHARAAVIADNQLTIKGGWDERALAEWLDEIGDVDADLLEVTGFSREDLDDMLAALAC